MDQTPAHPVFVPAGEHYIDQPLLITQSGSGLYGPGRIVQRNPQAAILLIRGASDVTVSDLTFTRAEGTMDTTLPGIEAQDCVNLTLENLVVLDNRSPAGSIRLERCEYLSIRDCLVRNYMTVTIDDRTASADWGYAFHCIDGTGILLNACRGALIQGNTVIETRLRPTPEIKERHKLGQFIKMAAQKGRIISQQTWESEYVNNWHQGSGILITAPEKSAYTRLLDNHVENAAQGIDLHTDFATVQGNIVVNCFMGMKAMHGSRNILIANNQFSRNDLWSIGLMPGAASHAGKAASAGAPPLPPNTDGGSIVTGNIISDFGYGDSHWIWKDNRCTPILLDRGQLPENPPLQGVILSNNLIHNPGSEAGASQENSAPPYDYAVYISDGDGIPEGLQFNNNFFPAGKKGICNMEITP